MVRDEEEVQVSRLLGEEMQRTFWEFHARDYLSQEDISYLRTTYCMDGHVQRELYDLYVKYADDGMEPGGNLEFQRKFWGSLEAQYSELLRKLDPLSRASALAARPARWYKPWPIFSAELWTSWIQPGNDGYVYGAKDTGKTDFLCLLAEIFIAQGGTVVSAIPLREEVRNYMYCTRGTALLRSSCELVLRGVRCLVDFDESFIHSSGEQPLKPEVVRTRQFARLFRKLGIASFWGSQRESDILKDIRIGAAIRVSKMSKVRKDYAHVQIRGRTSQVIPEMREGKVRVLEFSDFVKWVPPTSLPFRTEAAATFVMDFDPAELMDYLADLPMEVNQYKAVLEWLDRRGYYFTKEEKQYLARKMSQVGLSQENIGKVLGVTQGTISNWKRAGKD